MCVRRPLKATLVGMFNFLVAEPDYVRRVRHNRFSGFSELLQTMFIGFIGFAKNDL